MGEFGTIFGGLTGKTKADFGIGTGRYVTYSSVFGRIAVDPEAAAHVHVGPDEKQRQLQVGDVLLTGSSETPGEVAMSSVVTSASRSPLYLNSFCIGFRPHDSDSLVPDFSKHLFRSSRIRSQLTRTASGVTRFNVSKPRLMKVEIPVPHLSEQREIAATLDKFDALTNDLSIGLPAEIKARRQQYEHYRDQLLSFKELVA